MMRNPAHDSPTLVLAGLYSRRSVRHYLREDEMTFRRILANIAVAVVLVAILFGIMAVIIDERLSKQLDGVDITFEEVKW